MKKGIFCMLAIAALLVVWTTSPLQAFQVITQEMMEKEMVTTTDLIRNVDNFIVLFDTSSSANSMLPGRNVSRIQATKNLLKERNAWLPDLGYQAGLYDYTNDMTLTGTLKEIYPVQPYERNSFAAAIDKLPDTGSGPTMLQAGLSSLRGVLAPLSGKTAVILFTDGSATRVRGPKSALQIAQEIAKDNDVCFYLVSSASDDVNAQLLETVSKVNACSRVVPLDAFLDNPTYIGGALFTVKTTSYARLVPVTQVVGAKVENILFDLGSDQLRSEYSMKLDQLIDFMKTNPDAYVVAAGYACSLGDEEYNLALSQRRAESVKSALTHAGIAEDRVVTLWFGELNPVASNDTEEGRRQNRRVEIAIGGV